MNTRPFRNLIPPGAADIVEDYLREIHQVCGLAGKQATAIDWCGEPHLAVRVIDQPQGDYPWIYGDDCALIPWADICRISAAESLEENSTLSHHE